MGRTRAIRWTFALLGLLALSPGARAQGLDGGVLRGIPEAPDISGLLKDPTPTSVTHTPLEPPRRGKKLEGMLMGGMCLAYFDVKVVPGQVFDIYYSETVDFSLHDRTPGTSDPWGPSVRSGPLRYVPQQRNVYTLKPPGEGSWELSVCHSSSPDRRPRADVYLRWKSETE